MGLKKGEKIQRLGFIRVISTRKEKLREITQEDVIKEGFPNWAPYDFCKFLTEHYRCRPDAIVNRIEFEYLD